MQDAIVNNAIAACRRSAFAALAGTAILLGGCESIPDAVNPFVWFEDDEPAPPPTAAGKPGTATADQPYPKLGTVPKRPPTLESQQASIAKGLTADNENARYTDSKVQEELTRRAAAPRAGVPAATVPAPRAVPPPPQVTPPQVQSAVPRPVPPPARRSIAPPSAPAPRAAAPLPVPRPVPPVAAPAARQPVPPPVQNAARYAPPPVARSAPSPVARPAPAPAFAPGQTVQVATIYFGDGSTKLQNNDQAILRQVAAAQRQSGSAVRVVGHASGRARTLDAPRRHAINYRVSLDRAHAVAAALLSLGVPVGKLLVEGKGDTAPLYAEFSATGEAANRRAELYFVN